MGEDYSAADNPWKNMVIGKSNNEWISTQTQSPCAANSMQANNFSLDSHHYPLDNVKVEYDDTTTGSDYDNIQHPEDLYEQSLSEVDPLMPINMKKRRRSSGLHRTESAEERSSRLAKMSAYSAKRLACETPEQRALRLKRMSEYASKRLAQETSEQRARRLSRMSAYAAQRLARETPEQRASRLARMSAYAAKRHATKKTVNAEEEYIKAFQQKNA